jgi:hypothetical protein
MTHKFRIGDRVAWNSEAGPVTGRIIKAGVGVSGGTVDQDMEIVEVALK